MSESKNNSKEIFSEIKFIRISLLFLTFFVLFAEVFLGYMIYKKRTEYFQIKVVFDKINSVFLDHSKAEGLIEVMERYGFETSEFIKAINSNDSQTIAKQLRDFASFMREYEAKSMQSGFKFFTWVITVILISMFLILLNFRSRYNFVQSFSTKLYEILKKISESLYIENIPIIQSETFKEESIINALIKEANMRNGIVSYFRELPYVDTIEEYIKLVGEQVCSFFEVERFSLALISDDEVIAEEAYFSEPGHRAFLHKGFRQKLGETSLGKIAKEGLKYRIINDLRAVNSKSAELIVKEGFLSNLTVPAVVGGEVIGFFFLTSKEVNHFTEEDGKLFHIISLILSPKLFYALAIQNVVANFGESLVNLSEYRDNETGNHIRRVSTYAKILAEAMKLEPRLVREIYQFAPLHDIGKIGIPDSILLKPGKLDDDEWEVMKTHVMIGVRIIEDFVENSRKIMSGNSLKTAINLIRDHHEKWDGSGYPFGKKGEEISIEGRILAVADVFDALTSKRPYKKPFSFEKAVEIIKEGRGTHFDPKVVDAFVENIEKIKAIYNELKDTESNEISEPDKEKAGN